MNTRSKRVKRIVIWTLIAVPVLGISGCTFWVPGRVAEGIFSHALIVGETREHVETLLRNTRTPTEISPPNTIAANFYTFTVLCAAAGDQYRIEFDANDRVKAWTVRPTGSSC